MRDGTATEIFINAVKIIQQTKTLTQTNAFLFVSVCECTNVFLHVFMYKKN